MLRSLLSVSLCMAILALPRPGRAQPGAPGAVPPPTSSPPPTESRWYGWEILAIEGVAVGLAAAANDDDLSPGVVMGGFLLAGPIVHLAHGHGGRAVGSLAMRAGVPIVGAVAFQATCDHEERQELLGCLDEAAIGFLGGMVLAEVIDQIRSHDEVTRQLPVTPTVMVSEAGAGLGLAGSF